MNKSSFCSRLNLIKLKKFVWKHFIRLPNRTTLNKLRFSYCIRYQHFSNLSSIFSLKAILSSVFFSNLHLQIQFELITCDWVPRQFPNSAHDYSHLMLSASYPHRFSECHPTAEHCYLFALCSTITQFLIILHGKLTWTSVALCVFSCLLACKCDSLNSLF